jgi:hypothetical protein
MFITNQSFFAIVVTAACSIAVCLLHLIQVSFLIFFRVIALLCHNSPSGFLEVFNIDHPESIIIESKLLRSLLELNLPLLVLIVW